MGKKTLTAVRGLPPGTLHYYRLLSAQMTKDTGVTTSMNSLYVEALVAFINKRENRKLINK